MNRLSYVDPAAREKMSVRLQALSIANNTDQPPADVVARAKAYIEFVEASDDRA